MIRAVRLVVGSGFPRWTVATLRWSLELKAGIDEVWAVIADTDAFNRRAGLGFKFARVGGELRGEVRLGGVRSTWRELPFEVEKPRRWASRRVYDGGPVAEALTTASLAGHARGTRLDYVVELVPRNGLAGVVVEGLARVAVRPPLDKALRLVEGVLAGKVPTWDPPDALSREARARLATGLAQVRPAVAPILEERVLHAPRHAQHALRPLAIAAQSGLPAEEVVLGCLEAERAGVLALAWEVVCPRCRGAGEELPFLSLAERGVHCEACGVTYDGSLVDQVEAVFRVAPAVRPEPVPVDCALSPRRTPHVLVQVQLAPKAEIELETKVVVGSYRLEGATGVALVEVVEGGPEAAVVVVGQEGVRPRQLTLGPGRVKLRVRSRYPRPLALSMLERWRPAFALSAATLLSFERARALLPHARLDPALRTSVEAALVVVVQGVPAAIEPLVDALPMSARRHRPRPDLVVLRAETLDAALDLAEEAVRRARPVSVGLAFGPLVALDDGPREALGGPAVDDAIDVALHLGRPRVAVHPSVSALPGWAEAVGRRAERMRVTRRAEGPDLLVFASMLDFRTAPAPVRQARRPASEPPPADPAPVALPEAVGPYRVVRELGRGGMGRVFEALDPETGEALAVKVLLPGFEAHDPAVQRFFNEAWYASRLSHPNLVAVRDFGLSEEQPWIAMERLVGRTLQVELKAGRLSPERAVPLVAAVCDALGALHAAGLVHRDLKPGNVFLVDDRRVPHGVKLLDFGLVRRAGTHRTEGLAGTPDYVAPEQLVGAPLGPEADVFALGVLTYRVVLGRSPFPGDLAARIVGRVGLRVDTLQGLEALGPLERAVRAALVEDPAARPATALAFKALVPGLA